MKKYGILTFVFILLWLALWGCGESAVQTGREVLPASWTKQSPDMRTISLNSYGVDRFLKRSLFGSQSSRVLVFFLSGFFAIVCLIVLRKITEGSKAAADPRWLWRDLLAVSLGLVMFWTAIPEGEPLQSGVLFMKDAALAAWILALGYARGIGPRELGLAPRRAAADGGLGIASALLLLPSIGVLVLAAVARTDSSAVPSDLHLPVPASVAEAWLSVLVLPFFEEILFRSFLYRFLRARLPQVASNGLTSVLFALIHGDAGTVGLARLLGSLLMCRLFERTGTVWSSLGAHAAFNAILLLGPALV